jgi:hypothetical protein
MGTYIGSNYKQFFRIFEAFHKGDPEFKLAGHFLVRMLDHRVLL